MAKPLLLVIDFINDIVHPESKVARSANFVNEHQVIKYSNQAIAWARKGRVPIVHVKVGFSKDYIECPVHSPLFGKAKEFGILKLDTWGTEFHEDINVQAEDTVIVKHRVSAFYGTGLEIILRANQIDTLIISGVSTNMTVELTAREAHDRDYKVIILEDACGAPTQEEHDASLKILTRIATIIKVAELEKKVSNSL